MCNVFTHSRFEIHRISQPRNHNTRTNCWPCSNPAVKTLETRIPLPFQTRDRTATNGRLKLRNPVNQLAVSLSLDDPPSDLSPQNLTPPFPKILFPQIRLANSRATCATKFPGINCTGDEHAPGIPSRGPIFVNELLSLPYKETRNSCSLRAVLTSLLFPYLSSSQPETGKGSR